MLQVLTNILYVFNLVLCFIYAQAAFPNDDTNVLYISYICFLPDDGPERAGTCRR
jgi:hypothetical protein